MRTKAAGRGDRLRVAVLLGGPSSEHEVSLDGGERVVGVLDPARFEVRPVVISRDGHWNIHTLRRGETFAARGVGRDVRTYAGALQALSAIAEWPADVVVPILHGRFGEDGTVQACLEAARIPFVGSGSAASALAFDKARAKEIFAFHGIPSPAFELFESKDVLRRAGPVAATMAERYGLPLVLKRPRGGSSLEVRIPRDEGEVVRALSELAQDGDRVMVEAYVRGRELTAGVLDERDEPTALPIVEIRPRQSGHFDYQEKYSADGAEELCPAPVDAVVAKEAQALGLGVHRILGLRGLSRTDLILDEAGHLTVLEVNTLPGMTDRGLVPRAAKEAGIGYGALVERLVHGAGV